MGLPNNTSIFNELSPDDLSLYYMLSGVLSASGLFQPIGFLIRPSNSHTRYEKQQYTNRQCVISIFYFTFNSVNLFLRSKEYQNLESPILSLNMMETVFQQLTILTWCYFFSRVLQLNSGPFITHRGSVISFLFTLCVVVTALELNGNLVSQLQVSIYSVIVAIQYFLPIIFLIILLCRQTKFNFLPSTRLVRVGLMIDVIFRFASALFAVFCHNALAVQLSILGSIVSLLVFCLITAIHYIELQTEYEYVVTESVQQV